MSDNWFPIPVDNFTFGAHVHGIIRSAVDAGAPAFANDLPGRYPWRVAIGRAGDLIVLRWEETGPTFMSVTTHIEGDELDALVEAVGGLRDHAGLRSHERLAVEFGPRRLLIVLDVVGGRIDGAAWAGQVLDWLNGEPARQAEANNLARVRAAIPEPPSWDIQAIADACWVVEDESGDSQGTAFVLRGVGFVTCHHVLHVYRGGLRPGLTVFHTSEPARRYPIASVRASDVLDLAVFSTPAPIRGDLTASDLREVEPQSHVAVCGFPNFRLGSSCVVSPGLVVATRMARGGVRRLLTNAGIVAGMSGGPAVGVGRQVIGVCANGAPWMQDVRQMEDQAIIPIAALDLLSG